MAIASIEFDSFEDQKVYEQYRFNSQPYRDFSNVNDIDNRGYLPYWQNREQYLPPEDLFDGLHRAFKDQTREIDRQKDWRTWQLLRRSAQYRLDYDAFAKDGINWMPTGFDKQQLITTYQLDRKYEFTAVEFFAFKWHLRLPERTKRLDRYIIKNYNPQNNNVPTFLSKFCFPLTPVRINTNFYSRKIRTGNLSGKYEIDCHASSDVQIAKLVDSIQRTVNRYRQAHRLGGKPPRFHLDTFIRYLRIHDRFCAGDRHSDYMRVLTNEYTKAIEDIHERYNNFEDRDLHEKAIVGLMPQNADITRSIDLIEGDPLRYVSELSDQ